MQADTSADQQPLRVMVVDDNKDAANSLCILLKLWGYDAQAAYDGEAALEKALAYHPDCLFLDIGLPRVDGYNLARRIRQEPSLEGVKLVALTAYSGDEHSQRIREAGFDYHLVKPADLKTVERLLKMMNEVMKLAKRTEKLSQQNVELARETNGLIHEAKEELKEMKEEIKEVKEEIKEVKEEIKEVKKDLGAERPDTEK